MKNPVSLKQIVIDFIYIKEQLVELFKHQEQYQAIIAFLVTKDYLNDDLDLPFPKVKDVEDGTGLKTHVLKKLLLEMHNQIFGNSNTSRLRLRFSNTLYHFAIKFYDKNCYFTIDKLEHLPRIGENIYLPFTKASLDVSCFYVENIRHEFEGITQNVYINLKVGDYNSFWHFRKDQALELNEIGFSESFALSDSQLKEKVYCKNQWYRYK